MVLSRALQHLVLVTLIVPAALATGCGQSLFDAHGGSRDGGGGGDDGGGGGGDGDVPDTCAAPCIADAAADFDGSAGGKGNHWRYLDDNRNRTWTPMMADSGAQVGADARNSFKRCASDPMSAACKALPGALLVSTGGRGSRAEPAIEYAVTAPQVIRIGFRAHAPAGEHKIRLYRNSREDVLFTMPAAAGVTAEHEVTVDAVPGDRFLVAISPDTDPGGAVALHVFISDAGATFPATCQLAVPFSMASSTATTTDDLCRGELKSFVDAMPGSLPPIPGPYTELGDAGYFENSYYQSTEALAPGNTMTVQLWLQPEASPAVDGWVFSTIDPDLGRGTALRLESGSKLTVSVVATTNPLTFTSLSASIASPGSWHFVRVVHASGQVSICVDGVKAGGGALAGPTDSNKPVSLGEKPGDTNTYLAGHLDDVRVFFEALPCN